MHHPADVAYLERQFAGDISAARARIDAKEPRAPTCVRPNPSIALENSVWFISQRSRGGGLLAGPGGLLAGPRDAIAVDVQPCARFAVAVSGSNKLGDAALFEGVHQKRERGRAVRAAGEHPQRVELLLLARCVGIAEAVHLVCPSG